MWLLVFQRLTFEFFWHILFFPMWWYTLGAVRALKAAWRLFLEGNDLLAPGLWLRNIFVPMFGQTDWQGRIMSFFVRLMNVIIRGIMLLFWLAVAIVVFLLWIAAPAFVVYMLRRASA